MRAACYALGNDDEHSTMARTMAERARKVVGIEGKVKILIGTTADLLRPWAKREGVGTLMRGMGEGDLFVVADLCMLGKTEREIGNFLNGLRARAIRIVSVQGDLDTGTQAGAAWLLGFLAGVGIGTFKERQREIVRVARRAVAHRSKAAVERAEYPMGYGFKRVKFRTYMRWLEMRLVGVRCIEMRKEGYLEWQIAEATGLPFWLVPEYVAGELRLQAIEATGQRALPTSPDPEGWPKRDGPVISDQVWKASMKEAIVPLPSSYKERE